MLNFKIKINDCYFKIEELDLKKYAYRYWIDVYTNYCHLGVYGINNKNIALYLIKKLKSDCALQELLNLITSLKKYQVC
jgi:hypothetical protein